MRFSDLKAAAKVKDQVLEIDLSKQELAIVPIQIKKFTALKWLDLSENPLGELPKWLGRLHHLAYLDISKSAIKSLPPELINCRQLTEIKSKGLSTKTKRALSNLLTIIQDANKFELDGKSRLLWQDLFHGNLQSRKTRQFVLTATNSSLQEIRQHALAQISQGYNYKSKQRRITKESQVVFVGILTNRPHLIDRLERQEIKYGSVLDQATTHLVVGSNARTIESEQNLLDQCALLTEQDLQKQLDKLETPYLMTDDLEEGVNNLQQMLRNTDDQLELAIEIMSGGGVPKTLETELFVVWKLHYNSYFQSKARWLLKRYALGGLADFIQEDTYDLPEMTENQLVAYLKRSQKKGGLDASRIAEELYSKHRKGIRFILEHGEDDLQKELLQKRYEGDKLQLSALSLIEVPSQILAFKQLKNIDLSHNPIKELPEFLKQLEQLESIDLRGTRLQVLPEWMKEMTSLRRIILTPTKLEETMDSKSVFGKVEILYKTP